MAVGVTICAVLGAAGAGVAYSQMDDGTKTLAGGSTAAAQASPSASATASPAPSPSPLAAAPAELANRLGPGVLRVQASGCQQEGSGTGFAIDAHHVVTNHHVVSVDPTPELVGRDGSVRQGRVIGWRESPDVAVIEVDERLPTSLQWAETRTLTEGQSLVALGYPVPELDFAVTQADIVSFKMRDGVRQAVRTDGKVDRGNSGGPAVTAEGRVAGVVTEMDSNDGGFQLVALLYTADALADEVSDILANPSDVAPDCEAGLEVLPEEWADDFDDAAGVNAYGDDPTLDALQDSCAAGDMVACDRLYLDSPVGSGYETFGATCGERAAYVGGACSGSVHPDEGEPAPGAPAPVEPAPVEPAPQPVPEVVEPPVLPAEDAIDPIRAACAAGDAQACDQLWAESPAGSEGETFGATCGGRLEAEAGTCYSREGF